MASNNNNNKSTILLTHTQTDRPLSPAQSENTNTESATRRSCAFARQGQKLRPLMRREREAGRERGREEGRAQRGREWGWVGGPRRWVVRWAALPRSCCLFRACVCACGATLLSYKLCPKFVTSTNTRVTRKYISVSSFIHSRDFFFKFLTSEAELNCWGEQSSDTHTLTHHLSQKKLSKRFSLTQIRTNTKQPPNSSHFFLKRCISVPIAHMKWELRMQFQVSFLPHEKNKK
jgi:hypothetical protein